MAACLGATEGRSLRRLEQAHTEASGGAWAVWLPSARAGICWALRAAIQAQDNVIGPAFTCSVVHEAMVRSGGTVRLLEPGPGDFLMDRHAIAQRENGGHGLVLCEAYGHTYDLAELERAAPSQPAVRIVDMAMSVPVPALFQRLGTKDFAVISFGNGKSMYAGWGGMGFARERALAEAVREQRDLALARAGSGSGAGGAGLFARRTLRVALRTAAHYPSVYALTWRLYYRGRPLLARAARLPGRKRAPEPATPPPARLPPEWSDDRTCVAEWRAPSTHLDRALALWNLEGAPAFDAARLALARRYEQNLQGAKGITRPKSSPTALSHYTVRVNAAIRNAVKQRLWQGGIYTISLWTFPPHLDREQFPATFRLSSEVINLPLSPWMSTEHVDRVCELLVKAVDLGSG